MPDILAWHLSDYMCIIEEVGSPIIYQGSINRYFESIPDFDTKKANSIDSLTETIELYYSLIGLEKFDKAFELFWIRLLQPMVFLGAEFKAREMLQALFPQQGTNQGPRLRKWENQVNLYFCLAMCFVDYSEQSANFYKMGIETLYKNEKKNLLILREIFAFPSQMNFA